jgi:hypothetical protein
MGVAVEAFEQRYWWYRSNTTVPVMHFRVLAAASG